MSLSLFQKAVVEERFQDAAYIRDNAGAGLVSYCAYMSLLHFFFFLGASVKGRLISDSSAGSMCIE